MTDDELARRVDALEAAVEEIRSSVQAVEELHLSRPDVALVKTRKAAEAVLYCVLRQAGEFEDGGKAISLDKMCAMARSHVPRAIYNHLRAIQAYANAAAHHQPDAYEVTQDEATVCLGAFASVVRWYG